MKLHCPHCGVKGSAEDSYNGRKVKCPKCQGVFTLEPDMVLELAEDATSVSTTPVEPSLSASGGDTINLGEDQPEQADTDEAVSVVAVDEQIEIAGDLAGPEAVTAPDGEEELAWEDVASEIDLQDDEVLAEEKEDEEAIELEEPVDSIDLPETDDRETGEETGENMVIDTAEDPVPTATEEGADTVGTMAAAESVEEEEGGAPEQATLVVEELEVESEKEDEPKPVEDEPYGVIEEQCWQCGKKAGIGESFAARDGRLYCSGCMPAEEAQETVVAGQEQRSDTTISAVAGEGQANGETSLAEVIKKTWAKIRNALSS